MFSSKNIIKVYIERHATRSSKDTYIIKEIENCISIKLNKKAKEKDGEGPQVECEVGDSISKEQAKQLSRKYSVSVKHSENQIDYSADQNIEKLINQSTELIKTNNA